MNTSGGICHWKIYIYIQYSFGFITCPHTGIPHFSKGHFTPLCFYKRPPLVPVFANWKNPKCAFIIKCKNNVQGFIYWTPQVAALLPPREPPSAPPPQATAAAMEGAPGLYLSLFCATVSKGCPQVSGKPKAAGKAVYIKHKAGRS